MCLRLRSLLSLSLTLSIPATAMAESTPLTGPPSMAALRSATAVQLEPDAYEEDDDNAYEDEDYDDEDSKESPASRPRKPYPELEPIDVEALNEDQATEKARELYAAAEDYADNGEWEQAIVRYEAAYRLVPGKHGFTYKVGVAAYTIRDCQLAKEYLEHLVAYGAEPKLLEKVQHARHLLSEIELSGCAGETSASGAGEDTGSSEPASSVEAGDRAPLDELPSDDGSFARRKRFDPAEAKRRRIRAGGAVMLSLGLLGIAGGTTTLILAATTGRELKTLSGDGQRYPTGDYACRRSSEACPYTLENRLKRYNVVTPIALGVGGAAFVTGVVLLAVSRRAKGEKASDTPTARAQVAPVLMPGGGGAVATLRF